MIVDRRECAVGGIADHLVQPPVLRLTREQAAAHVDGLLQIGLNARQHRKAARHMEAADHHWKSGFAQRPRDIERARKLI